jgi:hypothetical protein
MFLFPCLLLIVCFGTIAGLAIAADRNFKTFEAAYPYVVRKLLTENSAATRKILHSVLYITHNSVLYDDSPQNCNT